MIMETVNKKIYDTRKEDTNQFNTAMTMILTLSANLILNQFYLDL